jgi:hypothetical protein
MKGGSSIGFKGNSPTSSHREAGWVKATRAQVTHIIAQGYIANRRVRRAAKKLGLTLAVSA